MILKDIYLDFIENLNLKMTFDDYVIDTANGSAYNISKIYLMEKSILINQMEEYNKDCGCNIIQQLIRLIIKRKSHFHLMVMETGY